MNIKDKKDIPALVFFSGLSGKIPNEVYNNFLNYDLPQEFHVIYLMKILIILKN